MSKDIQKIAIVGLGLIGGSLGLALKTKKGKFKVVGFDANPKSLKSAFETKAVDESAKNLPACLKNVDVVFLSMPVEEIIKTIKSIKPFLKAGCLVTDTGSTKKEIVKTAKKFLGKGVKFIGGHPMAGKEKSGIASAEKTLFKGCTWCLCTDKKEKSLEKIISLTGANILKIDDLKHDKITGAVSHLPLAVAVSLVNTLSKDQNWPIMQKMAAGGFRDTTRVASGDPDLGLNIFLTNKKNIVSCIEDFISNLEELKTDIQNGNRKELFNKLNVAKKTRDCWIKSKEDKRDI